MSVERRINLPAKGEFVTRAEAIKSEVGLDEAIAQDIYGSLSAEARAGTTLAKVLQRVRQRIDPKLVDSFYQTLQSP
jgi:hypothetical protein